jgi:hypothetical protein
VQFYRRDWNWTAPTAGGANAGQAAQAIRDITNWTQRLAVLPGGQGRIELLAAPIIPTPVGGVLPPAADRGVVIVSVRWSDARWEATPADQRNEFAVRSRL